MQGIGKRWGGTFYLCPAQLHQVYTKYKTNWLIAIHSLRGGCLESTSRKQRKTGRGQGRSPTFSRVAAGRADAGAPGRLAIAADAAHWRPSALTGRVPVHRAFDSRACAAARAFRSLPLGVARRWSLVFRWPHAELFAADHSSFRRRLPSAGAVVTAACAWRRACARRAAWPAACHARASVYSDLVPHSE